MSRTDEIAARVEAAPDGPWIRPWGERVIRSPWIGNTVLDSMPALDFCSAARDDVPWLLEENAKLRDLLSAVIQNYRRAAWCECHEHWDQLPYPHDADCPVAVAGRALLEG